MPHYVLIAYRIHIYMLTLPGNGNIRIPVGHNKAVILQDNFGAFSGYDKAAVGGSDRTVIVRVHNAVILCRDRTVFITGKN